MSLYKTEGGYQTRWEIRSLNPLPTEWTNVFYSTWERDHGENPWSFERCPAILVMEMVAQTREKNGRDIYGELHEDAERPSIRETAAWFGGLDEFHEVAPLIPGTDCYVCTVAGGPPDAEALKQILQNAVRDAVIKPPVVTT